MEQTQGKTPFISHEHSRPEDFPEEGMSKAAKAEIAAHRYALASKAEIDAVRVLNDANEALEVARVELQVARENLIAVTGVKDGESVVVPCGKAALLVRPHGVSVTRILRDAA